MSPAWVMQLRECLGTMANCLSKTCELNIAVACDGNLAQLTDARLVVNPAISGITRAGTTCGAQLVITNHLFSGCPVKISKPYPHGLHDQAVPELDRSNTARFEKLVVHAPLPSLPRRLASAHITALGTE